MICHILNGSTFRQAGYPFQKFDLREADIGNWWYVAELRSHDGCHVGPRMKRGRRGTGPERKVGAETHRETEKNGDHVASRGKVALDLSFPRPVHLNTAYTSVAVLGFLEVSRCLCWASLLLTLIKFECVPVSCKKKVCGGGKVWCSLV